MNFNSLFFPAPQKSYSHLTFYNELIYIPKNIQKTQTKQTVQRNGQVTLQYQRDQEYREKVYKTHKLLIYFHGNAEDIGHSSEFLNQLSSKFHLNVLSVEYPGYGIYRNEPSDSDAISQNAEVVFDFVVQGLKFDPKDIVLFGRSMGSGPATFLAELAKPAALILLSPYTSLRDCVKSLLGTLPSLIVKERFKNLDVIKKVTCPTLIVHGQSDTLIPFSHAQQLHLKCGGPSKLIMPKKMTHNEFDLQRDLFEPIKQFFIESNILTSVVKGTAQLIKDKYFVPPRYIREQHEQNSQKSFITESDHVDLDEHRNYDSLKRAKSSQQLVPLIMTQAYQKNNKLHSPSCKQLPLGTSNLQNPSISTTERGTENKSQKNSSSFKLPTSILSLANMNSSSSPKLDSKFPSQKEYLRGPSSKILFQNEPEAQFNKPSLQQQAKLMYVKSKREQEEFKSSIMEKQQSQQKLRVKIQFNNIIDTATSRNSENIEPSKITTTLLQLKTESDLSGGTFMNRHQNGSHTQKHANFKMNELDQPTESTVELTQRLESHQKQAEGFKNLMNQIKIKERTKLSEELKNKDNFTQEINKKRVVLQLNVGPTLNNDQWVSRIDGRDKSPAPQSEEKLKLEIKESVKAKNINGIEPDKRNELCKSVKSGGNQHRVFSPQTTRAQTYLNQKHPLIDVCDFVQLRQATVRSRAVLKVCQENDLATDNTAVQDELRAGDQLQIKILKGLFERKSISLSKAQSVL